MPAELEDRTIGSGGHVAHFYADDADLARQVTAYLSPALEAGAAAIVIATEPHRDLFATELEAAGLNLAECSRAGALVLLDAATTLARFCGGGRIDHDEFRRVIGSAIQNAAVDGRDIYAYGEMVALLWEAGDVPTAIELESAWNDLATEMPFRLLCAYRSESVEGDELAVALHDVCRLHTAVSGRGDLPQSDTAAPNITATFGAEPTSAASARQFVVDVLDQQGQPAELLENAKLVVSELATNAIIHAHSAFSVEVTRMGNGVRLAVRDGSPTRPVVRDKARAGGSGRGLRIVGALAADWGVELTPHGKTVWAELLP